MKIIRNLINADNENAHSDVLFYVICETGNLRQNCVRYWNNSISGLALD